MHRLPYHTKSNGHVLFCYLGVCRCFCLLSALLSCLAYLMEWPKKVNKLINQPAISGQNQYWHFEFSNNQFFFLPFDHSSVENCAFERFSDFQAHVELLMVRRRPCWNSCLCQLDTSSFFVCRHYYLIFKPTRISNCLNSIEFMRWPLRLFSLSLCDFELSLYSKAWAQSIGIRFHSLWNCSQQRNTKHIKKL